MKCQGDPDLGAQDQVNYEWNESKFYNTHVRYTCRVGTAFDGLFVASTWGNCTTQTSGSDAISWKYNATNPLPSCIREFIRLFVIYYNIIITFQPIVPELSQKLPCRLPLL